MAPQANIDYVGKFHRSFPTGPDSHLLVQIGRVVYEDVQMAALITDSLKQRPNVIINREITCDCNAASPRLVTSSAAS